MLKEREKLLLQKLQLITVDDLIEKLNDEQEESECIRYKITEEFKTNTREYELLNLKGETEDSLFIFSDAEDRLSEDGTRVLMMFQESSVVAACFKMQGKKWISKILFNDGMITIQKVS